MRPIGDNCRMPDRRQETSPEAQGERAAYWEAELAAAEKQDASNKSSDSWFLRSRLTWCAQ